MAARIVTTVVALALACLSPVLRIFAAPADEPAPSATYEPSVADLSAAGLLATAREALARLDQVSPLPGVPAVAGADADAESADTRQAEINAVDRDVLFSTAITSLTALYQLHGQCWALAPLRGLYQREGCPPLHVGYSADGRLLLRIEPLELRKPAFESYTVLLCTLESHTSQHLRENSAPLLRVTLLDGSVIYAQTLTPEHPLFGGLSRLAESFAPPPELPSGAAIAFKQLFEVPGVTNLPVSAVLLNWGGGEINVPFYENEVGID